MQQRRSFIRNMALLAGVTLPGRRSFAIPKSAEERGKPLLFGIISDLHHLQFGQDEGSRFKGFMDAVMTHSPDFIIQNGDFCRPRGSDGIMKEWNRYPGPK